MLPPRGRAPSQAQGTAHRERGLCQRHGPPPVPSCRASPATPVVAERFLCSLHSAPSGNWWWIHQGLGWLGKKRGRKEGPKANCPGPLWGPGVPSDRSRAPRFTVSRCPAAAGSSLCPFPIAHIAFKIPELRAGFSARVSCSQVSLGVTSFHVGHSGPRVTLCSWGQM